MKYLIQKIVERVIDTEIEELLGRIARKKWWDEELSLARSALRDACKAILKVHYALCQKDFNRLVRQKRDIIGEIRE